MTEGASQEPVKTPDPPRERRPNLVVRISRGIGHGLAATASGLYHAVNWLLPGRRLVGLVLTGLIVAALLFPKEARDHIMTIWRAIDPPRPSGLIVVDSPQIFTRERLVNDRFTEERWLAAQLDRTDSLLDEGRFARPYLWMQEAVTRSMGGKPEGNSTTDMEVEESDRPAPIWEYEDAMAYRNRIRYAKIATQLDDAHDIDSNTLYRMNFSISVLPDRDEHAVAVVRIAIKESDLAGELEHYYTQLLSEYVDVLQETVNNVYDDRLSTLELGQGFAPSEADQVDHFLRYEVEKLLPRLALPSEGFQNAAWQRKTAETFINRTLGRLMESQLDFIHQQNTGNAYALSEGLGPWASEEDRDRVFGSFLTLCQSGRSSVRRSEVIPPYLQDRAFGGSEQAARAISNCSGMPRNWALQARFQIITALRAITAQVYELKDYSLPIDDDGKFKDGPPLMIGDDFFRHPCARTLAAGQAVREADVLDAIAYVLYGSSGAPPGPARNQPPHFDHGCQPFAKAVRAARRDLVGGLGPGVLPPLRIGVAEYVRRTMELLPSRRLTRRLSHFFTFELANCAPTRCSIKVSDRYGVRGDGLQQSASARARIHEFYENLNCGARAQTYALTPKKDTSYLGLQHFSQATMALLSENSAVGPVTASAEKRRKGQVEQPTIIGLGDWGTLELPGDSMQHCLQNAVESGSNLFSSSRTFFAIFQQAEQEKGTRRSFLRLLRRQSDVTTHFGWMILPHAEMGAEIGDDAQVDDSVLVSALVSLPSWWGRAQIEVQTCWMQRNEVATILRAQDLCSDVGENGEPIGTATQHHVMHVKLPGTAEEVLSRMAFFPLKAPYLTEGRGQPNVVEVGRPGEVTLVGSRLWKNPRVRLGHQWADSVEVLPDMRGLIAHFACVEPEPGLAGQGRDPGASGDFLGSNRPVRIWTSEGTTSTLSVIVRPFASRNPGDAAKDPPCWEPTPSSG